MSRGGLYQTPWRRPIWQGSAAGGSGAPAGAAFVVVSVNLSNSTINMPAANAGDVIGAVTITTIPPGNVATVTLGGPDAAKFALTNGGVPPCNLVVGASNIPAGSYNISLTAGPPTVWTPLQLSGLVAYWRADRGVVLSGSNVVSWADQSGQGRTLTAVGTPSFNATGFNAHPGISFVAGASTRLTSAAFNLATPNIAAFMVGIITGSGSDGRVLAYADAGLDFSAPQNILLFDSSAANTLKQFQNGISLTASILDNNNYRLGSTFDATSRQEIFANNASVISGVSGSPNTLGSATSVFSIGANLTGGSTCAGFTVSEVVLLSSVPNSADRLLLDTYFRSQWGL